MPELPDVEVFRQYLNATSLHQQIQEVRSLDSNILWKTSPARFRSVLNRSELQETIRHGKYLFARLSRNGYLGFHFGMSGSLKYFKHGDQIPEHTRILICFGNGYHLAYVSVRKLGRLFIANDVPTFVKKQYLGPDALAVDFRTFRSIFENRQGSVKTFLMNQHRIAGLGNIYADEILFQAGVRPTRACHQLSAEEWQRIFRIMRSVLNAVIKKQAQPERFPRSYLTPHRSLKKKCPRCGVQLKRVKVGGRTTFYCPRHQT